jgi:hypothetical protein
MKKWKNNKQNVLALVRYPITLLLEVRNKIHSSGLLVCQRLHIMLIFLQPGTSIRHRLLLLLDHALEFFQFFDEAGERCAFFLEFLLGLGVCGLGTTNERVGGWMRKEVCGNMYLTDCKLLSELLPQLDRASPHLLKRTHHFFVFLQFLYNTPAPT